MLIDPWEIIVGTFLLFVLVVRAMIAVLCLAVRLCVWTYRGGAWALTQYQVWHARRALHA